MRNRTALMISSALTLAFAAGAASAVPFSSPDPRSFAMGGAGVAAGTSANAVFLNPALLGMKRERDRFSIELPIVGGRLLDQGDIVDAFSDFDEAEPIGRFESAIDAYRAAQNATTQAELIDAGNDLVDSFRSISNKVLQLEGSAAIVVGVPGERLGVSVFANAQVVGGMIGDFQDLDEISRFVDAAANNQPIAVDDDLTLDSEVRGSFAVLTEVGVGLARKFDWLGGISLGVTPKYVQVDTYDYVIDGQDIDNVDVDLEQGKRSDSGFNLDIGAAKDFGNGLVMGLSVRNLISQEYTTAEGNEFKLEPMARIGAAWRPPALGWVTLAADLDLTENEPAGLDSKTQYAGIGVEFDAFRTLQLRFGYRHNLSDLPDDLDSSVYSAGIGFSPFGVHLDAAVAGNSDDIGAALQFGFRF